MKPPHISIPRIAALAGLSLITPAFAVVNIDYVTVGNAGNAADTATGSLYGAVAYAYQIAKNETTISQYAEFLNAVAKTDTYSLYSTSMTTSHINGISQSGSSGSFIYAVNPGSGNKPITFVSWFDAARFTNWMHNGQLSGEWNDAVISSSRAVGGGSWNGDPTALSSYVRPYLGTPMNEEQNVGFRVASAVPEPTSLVLTLLTSGALMLRRKRG